jgi:hypothetical protein
MGFLGMFALLDYMHCRWKNCPIAWHNQFTNKNKHKLIILEAIANKFVWIWYVYFELPKCNNNLNLRDRTLLVTIFLQGPGTNNNLIINGNFYQHFYLLADMIYPRWFILFKQSMKRKMKGDNILQNVKKMCGRMWSVVATLALGLQPKQRGLQGCASKSKPGSHTTCFKECRKV